MAFGVACILVTTFLFRRAPGRSNTLYHTFPSDFVWGTATSSYQIEGAVKEDGRGPSIWDVFSHEPGNTLDNVTGDVTCDHYHRMEEDVALMKSLNVKAYRFSISWSRILPKGTGDLNPRGIQFYSRLIDTLLANDIEPWVTLFHWDLPQALEEEYGGWLDMRTSEAFAEYARICFEQFGDRVKRWITLNESWTVSVAGYNNGVHAPGHKDKPSTEPYIVGHHLLLAHAKAVRVYKQHFATEQKGLIGISNCGDFRYPLADNDADKKAAERAMLFQLGWFVDPILLGDYPSVMREQLGDRLPYFSPDEHDLLLGSTDFLGLNYYSALLATDPKQRPTFGGYWADIFVDFSDDPLWEKNEMGWNVVPDGLREMLLWISKRYDDPLIYITENGAAFDEPDLATAQHDESRRGFFEGHLRACAESIEAGVSLAGYFAWSLMDNFEWQYGLASKRFGLCFVDFDTLERTPKLSGLWYSDTIRNNGHNIAKGGSNLTPISTRRNLAVSPVRELPETVLIGYGSDCDAVRRAVQDGVNVVIWAFMDIVSSDLLSPSKTYQPRVLQPTVGQVVTDLDLPAIRDLIDELNQSGYDDVVHLVSFGGWNGPHLDPNMSADEWYSVWIRQAGDIFHGIDWDLEGNDYMESASNFFTINCLDKIGEISRMAKEDGFFVSVAPPQSYLDIHGTSRFSRYVNLTDPHRQWHSEFHYFGTNVYAYLLAKYDNWIDLISVQLYESYSRAAQAVYSQGVQPGKYLEHYVECLLANDFKFFVDFSEDSLVDLSGVDVAVPLSKLVFGLGNGWVDTDGDKNLFISPHQVQTAWQALKERGLLPRGLMFWTIDEEGSNGVNLAQGLNAVLHIRP